MRLAFLGTPDFAATILDRLIADGHDVICVYAQPARPAGRGQRPLPSPVETLARAHAIEIRTPATLRDESEIQRFRARDLDAAIVAAYGLILPQALLDAPRLGCFNVHASLLPRWRGAAPIQRAILAGDAETGITIMRMEAGLDTGPMLTQERIAIDRMTGGALHDALAALGARLMAESLPRIQAGTLGATRQPEAGVTYAAKIDKAELAIDWRRPAVEVERLVRAFAPKPGAHAGYGGERIKILAAELADGAGGAPGTVLDDRLTIACGAGAVRPTRLQRPGKAPLDVDALLRGWRVARGETFS